MRITVEIKTTKSFEIHSEVYPKIEGLEGYEAFNKIIEVLGAWNNQYKTDSWTDSEKLELLEEKSSAITWSDAVEVVSYEQRYKVYDFNKYRTLFSGSFEECQQFLLQNPPVHERIEITEY